MDIALLRAEYEIFGTPAEELASRLNVPLDFIQKEIETNKWVAPQYSDDAEDFSTDSQLQKEEQALALFQARKNKLLALEKATLEKATIGRLQALVESAVINDPKQILPLVNLFSAFKSNNAKVTLSNLPEVIIQDFTGE